MMPERQGLCAIQGNHKCVEASMQHNCAVCLEYLFDSCKPISVLQCGHTMHAECLDVCPNSLQCVVAAWDGNGGCGLTTGSFLQGLMICSVPCMPCLSHVLPYGHLCLSVWYLLANISFCVCCSCTSGATTSTALSAVTLWPRKGSNTSLSGPGQVAIRGSIAANHPHCSGTRLCTHTVHNRCKLLKRVR